MSQPNPSTRLSGRARLYLVLGVLAFVVIALIDTGLRSRPAVGSTDMLINPVFRIPAPPRGTPYNPTKDVINIAWLVVVGLVGVVLGIRDGLKTRSLLPLMVAVSGVAIVVPEVFVDVLGGVYMPDGPFLHVFTILGRDMGAFILAGWFGYGAFTYFIYRMLMTRPKTKVLWWFLAAAGVGDVVFEEILLSMGMYHYYGNQPLVLLHLLPWWWIPCNSVGCFLAAALAYRYRSALRGWRAIGMIVITPISVMGVYGFIAMPSFIAVNGAYPWLLTQVLGFLTIALGIVAFAVILQLVLGRHPFAGSYVPPADEDTDGVPAPRAAADQPALGGGVHAEL